MTEAEVNEAYKSLLHKKDGEWMRKSVEVRFLKIFKLRYVSEYRGNNIWKHFIDVFILNWHLINIFTRTGPEYSEVNDRLPYVYYKGVEAVREGDDVYTVEEKSRIYQQIKKGYETKKVKVAVEASCGKEKGEDNGTNERRTERVRRSWC